MFQVGGQQTLLKEFSQDVNRYLMNWLKVAVSEIGGHLAQPLLLLDGVLGQLLSGRFHREANEVVHADVAELRGLGFVLLGVDDEERDAEDDAAELVGGLDELSGGRQLVTGLKPLHEVVKLQADGRQTLK